MLATTTTLTLAGDASIFQMDAVVCKEKRTVPKAWLSASAHDIVDIDGTSTLSKGSHEVGNSTFMEGKQKSCIKDKTLKGVNSQT